MPKYAITLFERVSYDMVVEADDESEAGDAAEALFVQSGDTSRDFVVDVEERTAGDPEEVPDDTPLSTASPLRDEVPETLKAAVLAAIAAFPEIGTDDDLNGGDAVDRLGEVIPALRAALAACGVEVPPVPDREALAPVLAARGYVLTDTAGGCKAWIRTMGDGQQVVVTSTDGGSEPTRDDWLIARYDDFASGEYAGMFTSTDDGPDGSFEDELSCVEQTPLDDDTRMSQGDEDEEES